MVAAGKHKALLHYTASKPFLFFDHPDRETASFPPSIQIDTTSAGSVRSGAGSAGFLAVGFFDAAPGFVCAVTADAAVRLYDTKTGKLADELQFPDISAAAFSAGRLAVVHRGAGAEEETEAAGNLTILKPTGKGELREADSVSVGEAYTGAVFSPEGNRLFLYAASGSGEIIGLGTGGAPAGGTSEPSSAAAVVSLPYKITAACWTGPEELALADSGSYAIHGYNPFSKGETFMLAGEAAPVWSVAVRDKEIAFGRSSYRYINEQTPLEQVFDLRDFSLREIAEPDEFRRIGTNYKDLEISWENHPKNGEIVVVSDKGDPIRRISRGRQIGASVWCYGITEDGFVLTGGYSGALHFSWIEREYADGGIQEGISWRHDAPLTAIAASPKLIATAGKDGIIRLYNREELYKEFTKSYRRSKGSSVRSAVRIAPAVSMIITPEGEYCLWTPEGYYTCSEGGSELLYRQKNLREGITPEIHALGEYKPENNRPDIIRERLGIGE
jgi:WD40 repeat protein